MRKDKKRTRKNTAYVTAYKNALKQLNKGEGDVKKLASHVFSQIDKAVKRKIIHRNKASRLKSRINKFLKKSAKPKTSK